MDDVRDYLASILNLSNKLKSNIISNTFPSTEFLLQPFISVGTRINIVAIRLSATPSNLALFILIASSLYEIFSLFRTIRVSCNDSVTALRRIVKSCGFKQCLVRYLSIAVVLIVTTQNCIVSHTKRLTYPSKNPKPFSLGGHHTNRARRAELKMGNHHRRSQPDTGGMEMDPICVHDENAYRTCRRVEAQNPNDADWTTQPTRLKTSCLTLSRFPRSSRRCDERCECSVFVRAGIARGVATSPNLATEVLNLFSKKKMAKRKLL